MPRYSPLWRSQENLPVEVKLEQTLADGKSQLEEEEGSSAWVGRRIMGLRDPKARHRDGKSME